MESKFIFYYIELTGFAELFLRKKKRKHKRYLPKFRYFLWTLSYGVHSIFLKRLFSCRLLPWFSVPSEISFGFLRIKNVRKHISESVLMVIGFAAPTKVNFECYKSHFHTIYLPSFNEICPIQHHSFGQCYFRLCIISWKMIKSTDKRSTKYVWQILAMYAALTLLANRKKLKMEGINCWIAKNRKYK